MKKIITLDIDFDNYSTSNVISTHDSKEELYKYHFEEALDIGIFTDQQIGEYIADVYDTCCCTAEVMFPILSAVDDVNCTLLDAYIKMIDSRKNPDARWCCGMTRDEFIKKRNARADYWSEMGYQVTYIN